MKVTVNKESYCEFINDMTGRISHAKECYVFNCDFGNGKECRFYIPTTTNKEKIVRWVETQTGVVVEL